MPSVRHLFPSARRLSPSAVLLALLALIAAPGAATAQRAEADATTSAADSAEAARAIAEAASAFSRALERGDAAAMAAQYTADGVLLPPNGRPVTGIEAITLFWTPGNPDFRTVRHELVTERLEVTGDAAAELGRWRQVSRVAEGPEREAWGRYLVVWRQEPDGAWRMQFDAWTRPVEEGMAPERVAPGTISTEGGEAFPALDPADGTLWFATHDEGWEHHRIVFSRRTEDGWLAPVSAPFSPGPWSDRAPRLSPDGARLYFASNRPRPDEVEHDRRDWDLWYVEREAEGGWSEAGLLPPPVSTTRPEYHPSVTRTGAIYFASFDRPGGRGRSDLYVARPGEGAWRVERLGDEVNSEHSEPDVYADPAGRFLIVTSTGRPDGSGHDDLYLSVPEGEGWSPLIHLGFPVNTEAFEYGASVSPDGRWLWFTSHRGGSADLYRIETAAVPALARLLSTPAGASARATEGTDSSEAAVRAALEHYLAGHATGDGAHHRMVFHPESRLFWVGEDGLRIRTSEDYIAGAPGRPAPDEERRRRRIAMVDVTGNAAVARVELDYPGALITDYFTLLRIDGEWRVVNKIFHVERREP